MKHLKAVFWDIDGTIADTELEGHRIAFNKAFNSFNLDWYWNRTIYIKLLTIGGGKNRIKKFSQIRGFDLTDEKILEIHRLKTNYYQQILDSGQLKLREGVRRLVDELQFNNVKQWIVTTSSYEAAKPLLLSNFNSENFPFDGLITSEDVENHKPHPQPYLLALQKSKIDSTNVLSIEDSLIGLRSASLANIKCLITLTQWSKYTIKQMNDSIAVVDSLGDPNHSINVLKGRPAASGLVDMDYLSNLL